MKDTLLCSRHLKLIVRVRCSFEVTDWCFSWINKWDTVCYNVIILTVGILTGKMYLCVFFFFLNAFSISLFGELRFRPGKCEMWVDMFFLVSLFPPKHVDLCAADVHNQVLRQVANVARLSEFRKGGCSLYVWVVRESFLEKIGLEE